LGRAGLNQTQGTNITFSATATSHALEFILSTAQPYTGGTPQLTVSDRLLPPPATTRAGRRKSPLSSVGD